jgi:hypothetical protein
VGCTAAPCFLAHQCMHTGWRLHDCAQCRTPACPHSFPAPPVRRLLIRSRASSAAIPDQAPGSGPLRVLLNNQQVLSLVRALQEGGRRPGRQLGRGTCMGVGRMISSLECSRPQYHNPHTPQLDRISSCNGMLHTTLLPCVEVYGLPVSHPNNACRHTRQCTALCIVACPVVELPTRPHPYPAPPVRRFMDTSRLTNAPIPDQALGSGPLRVLLKRFNRLSLVRAPQEGGRVPGQQNIAMSKATLHNTPYVPRRLCQGQKL